VKRYLIESIRSKDQIARLSESSGNPLDVLAFGSFNQFRDLVAQKTSAALAQVKDIDGNNLLMLAAMAGKLEYVKFLYDQKGFDINYVNVLYLSCRNKAQLLFI
jgi:ankyrin repeat protein